MKPHDGHCAKGAARRKTCRWFALLTGGFAFLAPSAQAQYTLNWFTIDGGGGTSTGGVYAISGTIGQPDAGKPSGGLYALDSGFWGVLQTPGAPLLSIVKTNGVVTVFWPRPAEGFVLDQTTALASPPAAIVWSQVPSPYQTNATHILITTPMSGAARFYRLRHP